MSSVDGRLIDSRWTAPYKAEHGELLQVYSAIGRELNTDAWMFGKNTVRGDNILVIAGQNATEEYLAHLREKQISYVVISDAANLREGLEAVGREFGIRSISVQGGGILNGALLADKLIDELSLVIYPGIGHRRGISSFPKPASRLRIGHRNKC